VAAAVWVAGCAGPPTPPGYGPGHARVSLVANAGALVPGGETLLGVSFDIEPGWHLYWNGQNDTGYPIRVDPAFPAGLAPRDLLWPAPARHVSPGNILDHVYRGRVTLLLPVEVAGTVPPGGKLTLRVHASWLACREACVPGEGDAALTLKVASPGSAPPAPGPEARAWLDRAERTLPRPWGEVAPMSRVGWEGDTLRIRILEASSLAFFPDTASVPLVDPIRTAEAPGDSLRLVPRRVGGATVISGVLAVREDSPPDTVYVTFQEPLPEPSRKESRP
jgi:DsbC/DsbD-like thiol-disulfide interchange protein